MDLLKKKYIILEIIPTAIKPERGEIIQISALKIDGLKIIDRFDCRLNEDKIPIKDFLKLINYDKDKFIYMNSTEEMLDNFERWCEELPLLIIDNVYTYNYLEKLANKKESVFNYLNMKYHDRVIEEMIEKYKLIQSNYIVDLIFEALIKEL